MAQLRSVTCHMGSHSVTCYPTQVNTPRHDDSCDDDDDDDEARESVNY